MKARAVIDGLEVYVTMSYPLIKSEGSLGVLHRRDAEFVYLSIDDGLEAVAETIASTLGGGFRGKGVGQRTRDITLAFKDDGSA